MLGESTFLPPEIVGNNQDLLKRNEIKKKKIELQCDPAVLLWAYTWRRTRCERIHAPSSPCSTVHGGQDMEAT